MNFSASELLNANRELSVDIFKSLPGSKVEQREKSSLANRFNFFSTADHTTHALSDRYPLTKSPTDRCSLPQNLPPIPISNSCVSMLKLA